MKIALAKVAKKLVFPYPDKIKWRKAIHDELDFSINRDYPELVDEIVDIMTFTRKDWPVPMEVGAEFGEDWGSMVEYEKIEGVWTPKLAN